MNKIMVINISLVCLVVALVIGFVLYLPGKVKAQSDEGLDALKNIQYSFRKVADQVIPVVVEISTVDIVSQSSTEGPFDFFFKKDGEGAPKEKEYKRQGLGSGVVVKKDGKRIYVLTNNHVVVGADEITVTLNDDETDYVGKLVGGDERTDLALIVFETEKKIPIAELGDSDKMFVGDWVLAVGNPFGYESTVTAGIVSAVGRRGGPEGNINDFIQTDAAINPGNSGGALVNIFGQVIGINTWIASTTGVNMGYGFAIPINNAKKAIEDFIKFGKIKYAWLGVQITTPSKELADYMGLGTTKGALVLHVFKGAPADQAGILPGDLIIKFNGNVVQDHFFLTQFLGGQDPDVESEFVIIRQKKTITIKTKLSVREDEKKIAAQNKNLWPGMAVYPLTPDVQKELQLKSAEGVVIINILDGTPAALFGFRVNDVIREINGEKVTGILDFYRLINNTKAGKYKMIVSREGVDINITLER